jgi:alkylhydroperoxidase family enzyme
VGRAAGITDEELRTLRRRESDDVFSEREKTALAYADAITLSSEVDADIFATVRRHFDEEEIIELTATITWEICAAKFNRALELE